MKEEPHSHAVDRAVHKSDIPSLHIDLLEDVKSSFDPERHSMSACSQKNETAYVLLSALTDEPSNKVVLSLQRCGRQTTD